MKKNIIAFIAVVMMICLVGCNNNWINEKNESKESELSLSYSQYLDLIEKIEKNLEFENTKMELKSSTLNAPLIVAVDEKISFDKKKCLSLNNEYVDSTQNFLEYEEEGYRLIIGLIYTTVELGDNLLYLKPNIQGDSNDFNEILSYRNLLIHVQLLATSTDLPSSEDFNLKNAKIMESIVKYLKEQ